MVGNEESRPNQGETFYISLHIKSKIWWLNENLSELDSDQEIKVGIKSKILRIIWIQFENSNLSLWGKV